MSTNELLDVCRGKRGGCTQRVRRPHSITTYSKPWRLFIHRSAVLIASGVPVIFPTFENATLLLSYLEILMAIGDGPWCRFLLE